MSHSCSVLETTSTAVSSPSTVNQSAFRTTDAVALPTSRPPLQPEQPDQPGQPDPVLSPDSQSPRPATSVAADELPFPEVAVSAAATPQSPPERPPLPPLSDAQESGMADSSTPSIGGLDASGSPRSDAQPGGPE